MKCSICLNIWHDVVTVAPCHHNFCNGCFSIWAKRCQKERRQVFCPQCRSITHSVGKNHILHYLEEGSLASNEDSYMSDEAPEMELDCPQCGIEIGGFRCNSSTVHLQCYGCRGMMPSRPDVGIPQNCLGCAKIFCGAYWRAHNFIADGIHFICNPTTLQPLSEHRITSIPGSTHGRNIHEQDITRRCIQQVGKALPDLIQEWIVKLDNREFVCVYDFLIALQFFPPDAANREDCWYGYTCRTQHHNTEHARKRNHVCRPSRGNPH
ncbi:hypothetical protein AMTRI_Chr11g98250 [Amborella trichopoda]